MYGTQVAMTEDSTQHKAKIALVALGGNALLQRGEDPTSENQVIIATLAACIPR